MSYPIAHRNYNKVWKEERKVKYETYNNNGKEVRLIPKSKSVRTSRRGWWRPRKTPRNTNLYNSPASRIVYWNGRGVLDKADEIVAYAQRMDVDLVGISETHLCGEDISRPD
jgi:hypothetical protein